MRRADAYMQSKLCLTNDGFGWGPFVIRVPEQISVLHNGLDEFHPPEIHPIFISEAQASLPPFPTAMFIQISCNLISQVFRDIYFRKLTRSNRQLPMAEGEMTGNVEP